ncbi:hypothetical protein C2G38_2184463, partial [Gigaspora rosea]
MSIQENYSETTNKGKRKAQYCNLEGHDDVICNYDQYGASIVTDQLTVPSSSQHLDLVGKALCRKHYNNTYLATARKGEATKFGKTPERLTRFFQLPKGAKMCHHCLYKTDIDPEYINSPDYLPAKEKFSKIPKESMRRFQGRSYVLGGDVIYSESEFQELESAYHEVCRELDEAKLELIPLSKKIKLMAGVLYTRQHVYNEKPIFNPDEFKKILEESEPLLRGFFDQLVAGTNPQAKSHMTNEKNKKRLVSFCYFLAGLNNKFINGFKAEVGFLLDASGVSSSAIETLASVGLAVRHETIARKKAQHVEVHMDTMGGFLVKNNENLIVLNVDDFHNIHEYRRSDTTTTHDIGHFVTILLKALPEMASVSYKNPNQEKSIHNKKGRKSAFANSESSQETYDERVERLLVHNYDDRIEQRRVDRSMVDTKLVDLKEGSLHTTVEYVDALRVLIDIPKAETYMKTQVLIAPMDYPGQLNVRRAVTLRIKFGDSSGIPEQILHVVPMIGPLHVSLNSRETV